MKDSFRAVITAIMALALAGCSSLPAPYETYAPADAPAPTRPQNALVVYGTTTTTPENIVDLGTPTATTPSMFTPPTPAPAATAPAAPANKTRRIAICYSRLWNSADAVRSAASQACGSKAAPRVVDQDVDLDACSLLTPTHAVFACNAAP